MSINNNSFRKEQIVMDALECLTTRRSIRKFLTNGIDKKSIEKILSAGQRAVTANNEQPCYFVAVTNAKMRKQIKDLCPNNGPYIEVAPLCVCVFCKNSKYYLEDGSAATQNILNAVHALGLGAVWVAGDKKDYADDIRKLIGISEEYKLISLVPIGYPDGNTPLTSRKPLDEVIRLID